MTREEAIQVLKNTAWLGTNKDREETEQAVYMAIHALHQPPNDDWERYSDFLWREAYERGKQEALKGGDKCD